MKDRIPTYPGRIKLVPVAGQANVYDMVRADEPVEAGTPLNKAALLTDQTAAKLGLDLETATPNEAFEMLANKMIDKLVFVKIKQSTTWTAPKAVNQLFKVFAVGGGGGGAYARYSNEAGGAGGSGYVNVETLNIPNGTQIDIICGAGGETAESNTSAKGLNGGDTHFGELLVAQGGQGGAGWTSDEAGKGGDGNAGGGASMGNGGNGGTYGGGGAGGYNGNGGNGGTYGGGGSSADYDGKGGKGGEYGGDAGDGSGDPLSSSQGTPGKDGKKFADAYVNILFQPKYLRESKAFGLHPSETSKGTAGGGYGGNAAMSGRGGGGGGYCGNGGETYGGGGGYCGDGGNGDGDTGGAGGGGGFFCNGGSAAGRYSGGGGGFFHDGGASLTTLNDETYNGTNGQGGNGGVLIMYFKED